MQATADSLAFAPPPEPAAVRGFLLAAIAHILLIVALAWGITWDKDTTPSAVEAELWSALPQEAAPPPPPPAPAPKPEPQVVQAPPVVEPPPPVVQKAPDIAIEREKQRKLEEARRHEEELKAQEKRRLEAQKKKLEEQRRLAEEKKQRDELAKKEKEKERAKQELDAKKREQLRKEQIARMQALASGTGAPSSQGTAAKSSGPSDSYAGRIRARVKPNIVFTNDVPGNPSTEVEVRMAPDGTIVARKINKSSGVKSWDDAVLRALDKTEVLPRDTDGRVYTPLIIEFKLRG